MQGYLKSYRYYLRRIIRKEWKGLVVCCIRANSVDSRVSVSLGLLRSACRMKGCEMWSVMFPFSCVARWARGLIESVTFPAVSLFLYLPQYLVKGFLLTLCNQNKCALNSICFWNCWTWEEKGRESEGKPIEALNCRIWAESYRKNNHVQY